MKFKLNGKSIDVPSSWDELTYGQYLRLINIEKDSATEVLSILTGIEPDILRKANIVGLDQLLVTVKLLRENPPDLSGVVDKIGKYKIPVNGNGAFNIKFESLEQFEDMRSVMLKTDQTPKSVVTSCGEYVAIYLQKIRDGVYDAVKADQMIEDEIKAMPAKEVISAGSFFLIKLLSLLPGTKASSPYEPTPEQSHWEAFQEKFKGSYSAVDRVARTLNIPEDDLYTKWSAQRFWFKHIYLAWESHYQAEDNKRYMNRK